MKKFLLTTFCLLFLFTSFATADSNQKNKPAKKQINNAIVAYNNLSLAIDFWHDATLKGNSKSVSEHKQMMFAIITEDIKDNHQAISYAKLNASYVDKTADKNEKIDDKHNLKNDVSVFRAKKLLFNSLKKSKTFAYSYRLLADYLQILKREIDQNKIEIAGDDSDRQENAGQVRFIK